MPDYASTVVPIAGAALLAALTGTLRRYGHHLERLSDLAEKMPDCSPARIKLDAAVQAEAARLLAVPRKVRVSRFVFLAFLALNGFVLLVTYYITGGSTRADAISQTNGFAATAFIVGFITYHMIVAAHYYWGKMQTWWQEEKGL